MRSKVTSLLQQESRHLFDTTLNGISQQEADRLLNLHGPNELPGADVRGLWRILVDVCREPMLLLLLGCGATYYLLGEPREAFILLGFVIIVIFITLHQETKSENALKSLRNLASPRALVVREEKTIRVSGSAVVPGDLLIIREGDRIPADSVLLDGGHLSVDESILTGEALPVRKLVWSKDSTPTVPGGDDHPYLYSGTLVVAGQGMARVIATGISSELGKIGASLKGIVNTPSPLEIETRTWVRRLAILGMALCILVVIMLGILHDDWLGGMLSGLTLAMAILPEEFPVIMTIFLAMGAYRLSKIKVLSRKSHTIETLGSTTVLCTDKTGTLTENRMQLRGLCVSGNLITGHLGLMGVPESHHSLIETAILASQPNPFDPMEHELRIVGTRHTLDHLHDDWVLQKEYPLTPKLLAMSCVWKSPNGEQLLVAAKGSPEAIMDLCHLPDHEIRRINDDINRMADLGLRILGVAQATTRSLANIQHDFDFTFEGLVGFEDPVRERVPNAIKLCHSAGVQVVMITGDYPQTAQKIGQKIGLKDGLVITGETLSKMSDKALSEILEKVSIFARVIPDQKLRIIRAFQAQSNIVGMTGDGVNDAPALKAANIGIAMGKRGTDVAREASDLVLLNDAFDSIIDGIRMGRRIFDNLRKAMAYVIAVHIPIAGMSILPIALEAATHKVWPVILMPVHIVFLELIIDPACSVVFELEPEEKGIMNRKPRAKGEHILTFRLVGLSITQGFVAFLSVAFIYYFSISQGREESTIRALVFSALVLSNLFLLASNRSWQSNLLSSLRYKNHAFWWVMVGTGALLATTLTVPQVGGLLHVGLISWKDFGVCLSAASLSITWFELYKVISNFYWTNTGFTQQRSRDHKKNRKM